MKIKKIEELPRKELLKRMGAIESLGDWENPLPTNEAKDMQDLWLQLKNECVRRSHTGRAPF